MLDFGWLLPGFGSLVLLQESWVNLLRSRFSNNYLSSRSFNFYGSRFSQLIESQKSLLRSFLLDDLVWAVLRILEPLSSLRLLAFLDVSFLSCFLRLLSKLMSLFLSCQVLSSFFMLLVELVKAFQKNLMFGFFLDMVLQDISEGAFAFEHDLLLGSFDLSLL